jgi:hypothetical protein
MRHVEELHKGWIAYASIRDDGVHFALTEANARAEALIYLLENKLLPTKNILCDEHATTNCNSYVPLRPRKNGRLGAEPTTAIYLVVREERAFQAWLHSADKRSIARKRRKNSLSHLMRRRKL